MPLCSQLHRRNVGIPPLTLLTCMLVLINLAIASLSSINVPNHFDIGCITMSKTGTITHVPFHLIRPLHSIPQTSVKMSRSPDGNSLAGSEIHNHQLLRWIQTDVKLSNSNDPLDQGSFGRIFGCNVSVPPSEVSLPSTPLFRHEDEVGWYCELGTSDIKCAVSDAKARDGTPSNDFPRPQIFEVRRRLFLDPGIAGCLEDEAFTPTPAKSPPASVRTCN